MGNIEFHIPGETKKPPVNRQKNKRRKRQCRRRVSRVVINIVVVVAICASSYMGYRAYSDYAKKNAEYEHGQAVYDDIERVVFESVTQNETQTAGTEESQEETDTAFQTPDFSRLKAINKDAYGWLKLYGTNISYPVVGNTPDNSYWLWNSFDGQQIVSGSIFVDCRCTEDSQNTIIYGHRMRDGTMFYELDYLEKEQYYKDNGCYISIMREDGTYIYQIWAVSLVDSAGDAYRTDFGQSFTLQQYIDYIKSKALYTTDYINSIDEDSRLLTLSTCQSSSDVPIRRIVCGVLTEVVQPVS